MEFKSETDYAEWIATTHGIVKAFERRGYALYELGPGTMLFTTSDMIGEFVQFGRAEDVLQVGIRHMVLPLVKESKDMFQVMKAIEEMVKQMRAPYFFNCKMDTDSGVEVTSKHLIDSVAIEPPFLEVSCDMRFAEGIQENTIEIPLADAATVIENQVMMALRGPKAKDEAKPQTVTGLPEGWTWKDDQRNDN